MTTNQKVQSTARRKTLSWLRSRVRDRFVRSSIWREMPARRLKDLTLAAIPRDRFALTFDDGPDPAFTPRVLEVLDEYSCHATFFMCGFAAHRRPDLVREVVDRGHTIGGHSWDHRPCVDLNASEWRRQLDDTHSLLEDLSGSPVKWFRPPYGTMNGGTVEAVRRRGLAIVLWSAEGLDWKLTDPDEIAEAAVSKLSRGGIVLLHDSAADRVVKGDMNFDREPTVQATRIVLDAMQERRTLSIGLDSIPLSPTLATSGLRFLGNAKV